MIPGTSRQPLSFRGARSANPESTLLGDDWIPGSGLRPAPE